MDSSVLNVTAFRLCWVLNASGLVWSVLEQHSCSATVRWDILTLLCDLLCASLWQGAIVCIQWLLLLLRVSRQF